MISADNVKEFLEKHPLFKDISDHNRKLLCEKAEIVELLSDQILISAEEEQNNLYLMVCGHLEAFIRDELGQQFSLQHFYTNDTIGEVAIIDRQRASALVIAKQPSQLIKIRKADLENIDDPHFFRALAQIVAIRLRETNNRVVHALKQELYKTHKLAALGQFATYMLLLIAGYNITLQITMALVKNIYTNLCASTTVIAIFTFFLIKLIKRSGYHVSEYGITLKRWRFAIKDSLIMTAIFLIIVTLIKKALILYGLLAGPLFDVQAAIPAAQLGTLKYYLFLSLGLIIYALFVPLQEFIARGACQSSLTRLLQGEHAKELAIIISSALFSAMHVHLSTFLAIVVFFPSLFWGWLYSRSGTLLSPVISHLLIGWYVIFLLGIEGIGQ